FTLIEVIAAMAVFLVVAGAALTMVIGALKTVGANADRVAAATVARSQAETLRASGAYAIPIGQSSRAVITSQGQYTVLTTANWVGIGQAMNPCNVGTGMVSGQSYVRVHVEVTSNKLRAPQTSDFLVYPKDPIPTVNNTGTATISVVNVNGQPVSGVAISGTDLTGMSSAFSYTTGADGCVFIPNVPISTQWQVGISKAGYMTESPGTNTAVKQVQALANTPYTFTYDLPASIRLSTASDGYRVPPNVPITLSPDPLGRAPSQIQDYPITVTGLWPRTAGYSTWLGQCSDSATTASTSVNTSAGETTDANLNGARIDVVASGGSVIIASHTDALGGSGGCVESIAVGTVGSSMVLKTKLPFGAWKLSSSTSSTTISIQTSPQTGVCSAKWPIPGSVSATPSPTPTPTASPSPSNSPLLIYPTVSDPCPLPA
ncbi:MAG: hypothetical protein Q8L05_05430, partial [Actinomycetota bacterium]|nr:hypothetical protein [Actinomycetota bacterium]